MEGSSSRIRDQAGPDWTGPGYKLPASRGLLNSRLLLFIRKVMEI
jgi:hypothetical protein